MYPLQFGHLPHAFHQSLGYHMQRVEVVAIEAILQLWHFKIIQTLELDVGVRECLAQLWLILSQQVECSFFVLGIHDKLGIVVASHLGCIGIHESWRRTADKARDACDTFVLCQHMLHRIGNHLGLGHALTLG